MFDDRGIKVWYCPSLTGTNPKALQNISRYSIDNYDIGIVSDTTIFAGYMFIYIGTDVGTTQLDNHPYTIKPFDCGLWDKGYWREVKFGFANVEIPVWTSCKSYSVQISSWIDNIEYYSIEIQHFLERDVVVNIDHPSGDIIIPNKIIRMTDKIRIEVLKEPDCRFEGKVIIAGTEKEI